MQQAPFTYILLHVCLYRGTTSTIATSPAATATSPAATAVISTGAAAAAGGGGSDPDVTARIRDWTAA